MGRGVLLRLSPLRQPETHCPSSFLAGPKLQPDSEGWICWAPSPCCHKATSGVSLLEPQHWPPGQAGKKIITKHWQSPLPPFL